jgi:hypothetical protein
LGTSFSVRKNDIVLFKSLKAHGSCISRDVAASISQVQLSPPKASIWGPSKVSYCDGLTLDGSNSLSGQLTYNWQLDNDTDTVFSLPLSTHLSSQNSKDSVINIPQALLPTGLLLFKLTVIESFTGLQSSTWIKVLKSSFEDPSTYIKCPVLSLSKNVLNTINTGGNIPACTQSTKSLSYSWKVLQGADIYLPSSKTTGSLIIPANSLVPGNKYLVGLDVSLQVNGLEIGNTTLTCNYTVKNPSPIAILDNANEQTIKTTDSLSMSGSSSTPSGGSFSWTCCKEENNGYCNRTSCVFGPDFSNIEGITANSYSKTGIII